MGMSLTFCTQSCCLTQTIMRDLRQWLKKITAEKISETSEQRELEHYYSLFTTTTWTYLPSNLTL